MKNPITLVREERGLSKTEFAQALGIGYSLAYLHERGHFDRLQPRFASALAEAGFDAEALAADYDHWFNDQSRVMRSRVAEATPVGAVR